MTDIWTGKKRSQVMGLIRASGNASTELRLVKILRAGKIKGWRRNQSLFGKPDFVFKQERVIIFVDGCFWHGCPQCYRRPKSKHKYWDAKVQGNKARDKRVRSKLRREGWSVIGIWEHDLSKPALVIARIQRKLDQKHSGESL